jgi:hypothetical protein
MMCLIVTSSRVEQLAVGVEQREEEQIKGHDARVLARARALLHLFLGHIEI